MLLKNIFAYLIATVQKCKKIEKLYIYFWMNMSFLRHSWNFLSKYSYITDFIRDYVSNNIEIFSKISFEGKPIILGKDCTNTFL